MRLGQGPKANELSASVIIETLVVLFLKPVLFYLMDRFVSLCHVWATSEDWQTASSPDTSVSLCPGKDQCVFALCVLSSLCCVWAQVVRAGGWALQGRLVQAKSPGPHGPPSA